MLSILNKLLTVQIITTTTLITFVLFSSAISTTESLPITSKPIESTAENLAWEAWLMVPVGQQQKTRKVTPKSIFIVPQKKNQSSPIQCPPGEHLFESGCIPTVNIDTEKILLTQLTNLVLTSGDYDYDYDEDVNDTPGAEKLEGSIDVIPPSIVNTADEPLKFDIFRDNFPIGLPGSGDSSGSKDSDEENVFFVGEHRRRPPIPPETVLPDLDTDSTDYGSHNQSAEDDATDADDDSTLFLSDIDAILVPAVPAIQRKNQNMNFSIYQEIVNTTIATAEKTADLDRILENESLFLVKDRAVEETDKTTTERIETTTDLFDGETTTLKLEEDDDVESKTEFTRSVTEVVPSKDETTISSTDSIQITSTVVPEEEDITTTMIPSEETTMTTDAREEITTIINSKEDTTIISSSNPTSSTNSAESSDLRDRSTITKPLPSKSNDRFVYHHLRDEKPLPPVIDLNAELKIINDLVAKKRQSSIKTTATPSVEITSSDLWTKIIPSSNAISTTSMVPIVSSSSSPSSSTTSTSKDIQSKDSKDSSSISSTISSTDSQGRQVSSSSTPSTSQTPVIAESNPFWWLPSGWRIDRTDSDRPLLLRFWSALSGMSGSQTKV